MIIEKLQILDYRNKEAKEFVFDPGSNIIYSTENTTGKTCLFKSIYYAIGLEIKSFPESWNYKEMIFKSYCNFDGERVTITRMGDRFFINDTPSPLMQKDYARFFANKINAHIKLPIKANKKMADVYSSAYILPYYIDQDNSWTDELYKDSSSNMEMYLSGSVPNKIFEYLLQIENDEIVSKEEELSNIKNDSRKNTERLEVLNSIKDRFVDFPKISCAFNEKGAKNEIDKFLEELKQINASICELKQKIYLTQKKIDDANLEISELDKIIRKTSDSLSKLKLKCPCCHTRLTLEQALTRMELKNNIFEIQHLKNQFLVNRDKDFQQLSMLKSCKLDLEERYANISRIMNTKQNNITLYEFIKEKSKSYTQEKYEKICEDLSRNILNYKKEISDLNKEIKRLKADTKEKKQDIENYFLQLRSTFAISFPKANLNEYDFLTFKIKNSSGAARIEVIFSLYLCYMSLLDKYSEVRIPMGADSIVKDEYDDQNVETFYKKINSHFLSSNNQTFFVSLEDKVCHLGNAKNKIKLKGRLLSNVDYKVLAEEFKFLLFQ